MKKIRISSVSILVCGLGFVGQAVIGSLIPEEYQTLSVKEFKEFRIQPSAEISGAAGSYTVGKAQLRTPFYGDHDQLFYGLAEGSGSLGNNGWFAGAGLGYRATVSDEALIGGYVIADYARSPNRNGFWIFNPGVELMGMNWNASANVYLPMSSKKTSNTVGFASDFGVYDYVNFQGHKSYDRAMLRQSGEEAGTGADIRVGSTIPNFRQAKVTLGGYYFRMKEAGNIQGVLAGLSYELNRYISLDLNATYDKYNRAKTLLGVKFSLGGYSAQQKQDFGISARLLDPVEHGYLNTVVPIRALPESLQLLGEQKILRMDNIWFIRPATVGNVGGNGVVGSGTYEDPLIGITNDNFQFVAANANIGVLAQYPMLYFAPGSYDFNSFGQYHEFQLPAGWGMFGRNIDYKQPATSGQRAMFTGHLYLKGSSASSLGGNNVINSVVFDDDDVGAVGPLDATVYLENVRNVTMRNVAIHAHVIPAGIQMENSVLDLYNTTINSEFRGTGGTYYWNSDILLQKGSIVNLMGGNTLFSTRTVPYFSIGIWAQDNSIVSFKDGVNTVNVVLEPNKAYEADAIWTDKSTVNFIGGTNTIHALVKASSNWGLAAGIQTTGASVINFNGGYNTLIAEAYNRAQGAVVASIFTRTDYPNSTVINFSGGINTFQAFTNDLLPTVPQGWGPSGIAISGNAVINFNGSGGNNTMIVGNPSNGQIAYGISVDSAAAIKINGGLVQDSNQLQPFINISRNDGYTAGNRIAWGSKSISWTAPWSTANTASATTVVQSINTMKTKNDDYLAW